MIPGSDRLLPLPSAPAMAPRCPRVTWAASFLPAALTLGPATAGSFLFAVALLVRRWFN